MLLWLESGFLVSVNFSACSAFLEQFDDGFKHVLVLHDLDSHLFRSSASFVLNVNVALVCVDQLLQNLELVILDSDMKGCVSEPICLLVFRKNACFGLHDVECFLQLDSRTCCSTVVECDETLWELAWIVIRLRDFPFGILLLSKGWMVVIECYDSTD